MVTRQDPMASLEDGKDHAEGQFENRRSRKGRREETYDVIRQKIGETAEVEIRRDRGARETRAFPMKE